MRSKPICDNDDRVIIALFSLSQISGLMEHTKKFEDMMFARVLIASGVFAALAPMAWAQTDMASMAHLAAANQLGVLEYCKSQGFVDGTAISSEQNVIARLPASSVATGDAEAMGKSGTLSAPNGTQMPLSQLASSHNTTIADICKQLGSSVVQSSSAMSQGGSGMSMPQIPGGAGQMPSMPQMPKMPTMPGMPNTATGTGTAN